eukprot:m.1495913 g.1495913  ORF g.1495913 m.1495913 type:complete len:146 (+) comp25196_c0_seq129:386-823(+)
MMYGISISENVSGSAHSLRAVQFGKTSMLLLTWIFLQHFYSLAVIESPTGIKCLSLLEDTFVQQKAYEERFDRIAWREFAGGVQSNGASEKQAFLLTEANHKISSIVFAFDRLLQEYCLHEPCGRIYYMLLLYTPPKNSCVSSHK